MMSPGVARDLKDVEEEKHMITLQGCFSADNLNRLRSDNKIVHTRTAGNNCDRNPLMVAALHF